MPLYVKITDLDCANCAQKIENNIKKIDGVVDAHVNFLTQKLIINVVDERSDEILKKVKKICKKVEPDCEITEI